MGYLLTQIGRLAESAISSVGAHLAVTVGGIFFFGIPAMISLGAYGMVIPQQYGIAFFPSLLISLAISLTAGLVFVLFYFRLSRDGYTIFTLTSLLAVESIIKSWSDVTGGVLGVSGIQRPELVKALPDLVLLQVVLMIIILIFEYLVLKSPLGRSLQGMKENIPLVESMQTSYKRVGAIVIMFSCVLAAIQGVLAAWRIQFLDPSFGSVVLLVQILTIAVVAARPKVSWLIMSVAIIILVPEALRFLDLPSSTLGHFRNIFYALILILVLHRINKKHSPQKRSV